MSTVDALIAEYNKKKPRVERKIFLDRQERFMIQKIKGPPTLKSFAG